MTNKKKDKFLQDFNRVKKNREQGKTAVFSEMRCATTNLKESLPFNILNGCFLIAGTTMIQKLRINELLSIAVVLIINNMCGCIANFIFVLIKHQCRKRLLHKMGLQFTEENIAILESLEYQTI